MNLDENQTGAVRDWLAEGKKVSEVQSLLSEKFGVSITYMDLRFLIDDLEIELQNPPEPEKPEPKPEELPAEGVLVELDKISRPGLMASGTAVFTDGVKASWELDEYGRFGLKSDAGEGYRPSDEDMLAFQDKLRTLLGA